MKSNKKLVCKVRRFFAMCVAVAILLGVIFIPKLETNAATTNAEPTDYYRIQWPVNDPKGYCNIHFVDKDGNVLSTGKHYIDTGENDGTRMNNVKSIWGAANEKVYRMESVADGFYTSLLDLVSVDSQDKFYNENLKNYEFVKAYIGDENGVVMDEEHEILPYLYGVTGDLKDDVINIRYYKKYSADGNNATNDTYGPSANGEDIYLVYEEKAAPTIVEHTVSNEEIGLDIYLFNYPNKSDGEKYTYYGGVWGTDGYDPYKPTQGLYSTVLEDGFPIYSYNGETVDMKEFFNPDTEENQYCVGKADKLFQQYSNGIYYYNSAWNAAYYDEGSDEFVLYEEVVVPVKKPIYGYSAYKKGNFLPFNDIDKNKVWGMNIDDELNQENTPVYGLLGTNEADYHFGMYLTGDIYQPENGKVKDTQGNDTDMIFNIRGDDDILVYIDDVLVMDLGGVHDPMAGSINFATGVVKVEGSADTTLKDLLGGNAKARNGNEIQFEGNTLANNSVHSFKVFYAERGYGASNLWVELNAPQKPSITIKNSFWLDDNGDCSTPFNGMNTNIQNAQYILKEVTIDNDGNITSIVNENVKTISYADFDENGTYVFNDLDYEKHYVIEQKLYDVQGNASDGSTNEHSYEYTLVNSEGLNEEDKTTKDTVTPPISFVDANNVLFNSTIEFKNVYNTEIPENVPENIPENIPEKGSIVIDNSFVLSKLDGTTESMDSAPNKTEFADVVFTVKDEAGNIVETVKYNQFVDGKYTVSNLDESKMYTIEITGISLNSGNGGTEEHSYVNTTIGGTKSYIIDNVMPSANGTSVQVVNIYDEYEENDDSEKETFSNEEILDTGDNQSILPMTVLLLLAFCGAVVCTITKRKKAN